PLIAKRERQKPRRAGGVGSSGTTISGNEQIGAMSRLRRCVRDGARPWNALAWRQRRVVLDVVHEQIERLLRVRLNEFELRERIFKRFDVVAVLHFVETELRFAVLIVALARSVDERFIRARAALDRQ